ncbi:hypothetical protein E2R51_09165 [Jeotgalibacillus sp. S-D1]|uniref:hypothetical protein n=1 Tax=Jeotgalibacillus sp. S-D1 TaxID=2552189 RepID=UPI00105992CA|nr:hypothetical protein [Jeotgalibacillus sp. S-D1]TDL32830.1 hypothetical protein E2R51_09165 [Jeotgalibacillus sp. S-D1]
MYIQYDEFDLLELFLKEPISISGDINSGELIYSYRNVDSFEIVLTMDVYRQECSLSITYKDATIFTEDLKNVTSIIKKETELFIYLDKDPKLKVKFLNQVGVELL